VLGLSIFAEKLPTLAMSLWINTGFHGSYRTSRVFATRTIPWLHPRLAIQEIASRFTWSKNGPFTLGLDRTQKFKSETLTQDFFFNYLYTITVQISLHTYNVFIQQGAIGGIPRRLKKRRVVVCCLLGQRSDLNLSNVFYARSFG